jgi:hypothetical protein
MSNFFTSCKPLGAVSWCLGPAVLRGAALHLPIPMSVLELPLYTLLRACVFVCACVHHPAAAQLHAARIDTGMVWAI